MVYFPILFYLDEYELHQIANSVDGELINSIDGNNNKNAVGKKKIARKRQQNPAKLANEFKQCTKTKMERKISQYTPITPMTTRKILSDQMNLQSPPLQMPHMITQSYIPPNTLKHSDLGYNNYYAFNQDRNNASTYTIQKLPTSSTPTAIAQISTSSENRLGPLVNFTTPPVVATSSLPDQFNVTAPLPWQMPNRLTQSQSSISLDASKHGNLVYNYYSPLIQDNNASTYTPYTPSLYTPPPASTVHNNQFTSSTPSTLTNHTVSTFIDPSNTAETSSSRFPILSSVPQASSTPIASSVPCDTTSFSFFQSLNNPPKSFTFEKPKEIATDTTEQISYQYDLSLTNTSPPCSSSPISHYDRSTSQNHLYDNNSDLTANTTVSASIIDRPSSPYIITDLSGQNNHNVTINNQQNKNKDMAIGSGENDTIKDSTENMGDSTDLNNKMIDSSDSSNESVDSNDEPDDSNVIAPINVRGKEVILCFSSVPFWRILIIDLYFSDIWERGVSEKFVSQSEKTIYGSRKSTAANDTN